MLATRAAGKLSMEQKPLIVILADLSGYTRFMLESRTAALHGQTVINTLIESILAEVDIPLTLQEIEGDAVFLYAAHPGSEVEWASVIKQVSRKLMKFFDAFVARWGAVVEMTACACAVCRYADQLGLKIVVHLGEAVFHQLAGRSLVSGPDVILAHRLLKNSVPSREYLLLSQSAFAAMAPHLPGDFQPQQETYEGFGTVEVRVKRLDAELLAARDALYTMGERDLSTAVGDYVGIVTGTATRSAALHQIRHPVKPLSLSDKIGLLWEGWVLARFFNAEMVVKPLRARGRRKPPSVAAG
jgi:hypothetical protein